VDGQNELVRSLQKQLEATERELANQKWVFERFLESPSWRMTYPVRWAARQGRRLRDWVFRRNASPCGRDQRDSHAKGEPDRARPEAKAGALGEGRKSSPIAILGPSPDSLFSLRPTGLALRVPEGEGVSQDLKELLTSAHRATLLSFLSSAMPMRLPHSANPQISIILVLYNRAELTLQCLRSVAEQGFQDLEIIIVDNASTDETRQLLNRLDGVRIIQNNENRNFLLAVNQAAREAHGEYLLLLNNDTQLLPGSLQSAITTIQSARDIGAVGGRLILLDWSLQEAGSIVWSDGSCLGYGRGDTPFAPMYMFRRDVDYCSAAFLLTPRALWQQLGGFDETFKPAYYEDSDYCARLWEHELRVVYDPNAAVLHYEFGSSANAAKAIELQRNHQKLFVSQHERWLSKRYPQDADVLLLARTATAKKRVLFIEDRVPHTWLGSGFPRARSILLSLMKQGFSVTFYPMTQFDESWSLVYSDMPNEVEFMMGYGPPLLEAFLRHRNAYYDLIFVSRPHNMKILQPFLSQHPEWFSSATFIYDAEALFAAREITFREMSGDPMPEEEAEAILKDEVALASLANRVISVSEQERKQFEKHGIHAVQVLGHCVAPAPTPRAFSEREGLLFAGAIYEEASPNRDSIIWFLEEIFPKIQAELGPIPLTMAGLNTSERVRRLAGSSVHITGPVQDLTEFYDSARVFIAPTRYSAGIPQKVHDAAARGLPIVATPLLALQLGWTEGSPILVAGDAEGFAAKCLRLYTDEALWNRLRQAGIERVGQDCSPELFENRLQSIVENGHRTHARGNA
jgi:GT2 family glycosyltransferase